MKAKKTYDALCLEDENEEREKDKFTWFWSITMCQQQCTQ